MPFIKFNF